MDKRMRRMQRGRQGGGPEALLRLLLVGIALLAACVPATPKPEEQPVESKPTAEVPTQAPPTPSVATPRPTTPGPGAACVADAAEAPGWVVPDEDLMASIDSYLMSSQPVSELESSLGSLCGSIWGHAAEPLRADVLEADLNGGGQRDLLVGVTVPMGGGDGQVVVVAYLFDGTSFTPTTLLRRGGVGSQAEGLYAGGGARFVDVVDMTGDGLPEIVFGVQWEDHAQYYIAAWVKGEVKSLVEYVDELGQVRQDIPVDSPAAEVEVTDLEGDGLLELVVQPAGPDGPEIWRWTGNRFELEAAAPMPSCEVVFDQEVVAYERPSEEAEVFATVPGGFRTFAGMRTADGWVGFDPGIAQAANVGVFRMRWVRLGEGVHLEGACDDLPVVEGPPPGVCFAVAAAGATVYQEADTGSEVLAVLERGDYVAAVRSSADGWLQVDGSVGSVDGSWTGWVEMAQISLNGPCEALRGP